MKPINLSVQDLSHAFPFIKNPRVQQTLKTIFFVIELAFVAILFIWWFTSPAVRPQKNLWILFLYAMPAEFFIAAVPHEPILLMYGQYYSAFVVAVVSVAGTLLAETLNYTLFRYIADIKTFKKLLNHSIVKRSIALFQKKPFLALCVAAFTPIPFYPFRFIVILARYPLHMYLLSLLAARTPRFFLYAIAGNILKLSDRVMIIVFAITLSAIYVPFLFQRVRRAIFRKEERSSLTS